VTQRSRTTPEARDRSQSALLVWLVGGILSLACIPILMLSLHPHDAGLSALRAGIVGLTFAAVVWALRAATPMAAFFGGLVCLLVILGTERGPRLSELHSGLMPLIALFVLTFAATKAGRAEKLALGVAEARKGRNAAQVLANLGAAGLAMLAGFFLLNLPSKAPEMMLLGSSRKLPLTPSRRRSVPPSEARPTCSPPCAASPLVPTGRFPCSERWLARSPLPWSRQSA
jgi:hypothetical protein